MPSSLKDPEVAKEDVLDQTTGAAPTASGLDHGIESSSDASLDDNYNVYKATATEEFDEAEAKRVLRKIDLHIVPVLFVTYFLQYLDKSEHFFPMPDYATCLFSFPNHARRRKHQLTSQ